MTTSKKSAKPKAPSPFDGPGYARNSHRGGNPNTTPCAHCGRPVNDPWGHAVRVVQGGARYATAAENELPVSDPGDMGCFPVGPDCAKTLTAAGVHVFDWK